MRRRTLRALYYLLWVLGGAGSSVAFAQPFSSQIEAARGRLKVFTTVALPNPCVVGMAVFDTTAATIKICTTGSAWASAGGVSSPITGDYNVSGKWAWPATGAANAVELGETAGCITFEGATGAASKTRVCGLDGNKDGILLVSTSSAQGSELSTLFNGGTFDPISLAPGTYRVLLVNGPNFVQMKQSTYMCFTDGESSGTCQGGLVRGPDSNGLGLRVGSGSAGAATGYINAAQYREPQLTTYTTAAADSGKIFTNFGDADGATITLINDPPVDPMAPWYDFAVVAAQTFTIQPSAGETLYSGASTCSTLASTVVGSIAHVVATTGGAGGKWMTQLNGTWVCTP